MAKRVSVLYFSGSGHTEVMAQSVREGAGSVGGISAELLALSGAEISEGRWSNNQIIAKLDESDAIVFGTPTCMGSVSAQMKAFMDAAGRSFVARKWKDKPAAGFTLGGAPSGDQSNTLVTLATFAMQHGMIWVGSGLTDSEDGANRLGYYWGAGGQALTEKPEVAPGDSDKKTGHLLGERVAKLCLRII